MNKFSTRKIFYSFLLLSLLAVVFTGIAYAQGAGPADPSTISDDQVNKIAKQLYCPVCESTPLDVCPTPACQQWRELIRQMLAEGKTETEIKAYFVNQYGDRVLSTPPARGLNLLVYIVPPVAIAAGVYLLYRALKGMRKDTTGTSAGAQSPAAPPANDEYVRRLEEELKKR